MLEQAPLLKASVDIPVVLAGGDAIEGRDDRLLYGNDMSVWPEVPEMIAEAIEKLERSGIDIFDEEKLACVLEGATFIMEYLHKNDYMTVSQVMGLVFQLRNGPERERGDLRRGAAAVLAIKSLLHAALEGSQE